MKKHHKITPEVRKQIAELTQQLPNVPYLTKEGKFQMVAVSKTISGRELIDKGTTQIQGSAVDPSKMYISRGREYRNRNHQVELTNAFIQSGQLGIDSYVTYVNELNQAIIKAQNPPKEKKGKNQKSKELLAPKKEDFGYVESTSPEDGGTSGWTIEGGEEAYYKAMAEWEEKNNPQPQQSNA